MNFIVVFKQGCHSIEIVLLYGSCLTPTVMKRKSLRSIAANPRGLMLHAHLTGGRRLLWTADSSIDSDLTIYPPQKSSMTQQDQAYTSLLFGIAFICFSLNLLNAADTCMPMNCGITISDNVCSPTRREAIISINAFLSTNLIIFK